MKSIPIRKRNLKNICESEFNNRAIPNYIVRSAIFGVKSNNSDCYFEGDLPVPCLTSKTHKLFYCGKKLGQYDFDVFQLICEIWRKLDQPNQIRTSRYKLLKLLNKTDGKPNYTSLKASLERLSTCKFSLETPTHQYHKGLINGHTIDKTTGEIVISIQPDFIILFEVDGSCYQDFSIRNSLRGELTKWLYGFYSSQRSSLDKSKQYHSIAFLQELCGSKSEGKLFKHNLAISLEKIQQKGGIVDFVMKNDQVIVAPLPLTGSNSEGNEAQGREVLIRYKSSKPKQGTGRGKVAL